MVSAADKREGRGRLSSIDLLPEEADEDIVWALEQLRARDPHRAQVLVDRRDPLLPLLLGRDLRQLLGVTCLDCLLAFL
jgi:hypothetical protein